MLWFIGARVKKSLLQNKKKGESRQAPIVVDLEYGVVGAERMAGKPHFAGAMGRQAPGR